jgi:hypothetical protein
VAPDKRGYYQNLHLPLAAISEQSVWIPGTDSSINCLITLRDERQKGCLLAEVKTETVSFYRLAFSKFWKKLFYPSEPFTVKEQIKSLIQGSAFLIHKEKEDVLIELPDVIHEGLPFECRAKIKHIDASIQPVLVFENRNGMHRFSLDRESTGGGKNLFQAVNIRLPAGSYRIQIASKNESYWNDSIAVLSKQHLELSRTGFDMAALQKIADQSNGSFIQCEFKNNKVAAPFPGLFAGQVKERMDTKYSLYNTKAVFFTVVVLMTLYWLGRKKLSLD